MLKTLSVCAFAAASASAQSGPPATPQIVARAIAATPVNRRLRSNAPASRRAGSMMLACLALAVHPSVSAAQTLAEGIRLNQVGFLPLAPKVAVVVGDTPSEFSVVTWPEGVVVLRAQLSAPVMWPLSGEVARRADFSGVVRPGSYALVVPGAGTSYPFQIGASVVKEIALGATKAFYYQRSGIALPAEFAGRWARAEGHPDTVVIVHPSAASAARPAGTRISAPRGWYDAGDYNKYVVNSGITTYTLLLLAEQFPRYADALSTNIPETGNELPDVFNEALWNIRWMLAMQDPFDGGVYHKLTNASFDGFILPEKANSTRFVVQKSTAATLDFAAVMAHATTLAARYSRQLPGFADSLTHAALAAWGWARAHPDSIYDQQR
ncbi:MAG: glycoside hydrolase family 9 protein, partial [bacterium]